MIVLTQLIKFFINNVTSYIKILHVLQTMRNLKIKLWRFLQNVRAEIRFAGAPRVIALIPSVHRAGSMYLQSKCHLTVRRAICQCNMIYRQTFGLLHQLMVMNELPILSMPKFIGWCTNETHLNGSTLHKPVRKPVIHYPLLRAHPIFCCEGTAMLHKHTIHKPGRTLCGHDQELA